MWRCARKELIDLPTKNGHASTIALVGEDVLMAWFGGTKEADPDVDIYMTRRTGGVWAKPWRAAHQEDMPHWNPVLFAQGDRVDLYYKVGRTIPQWQTRRMRSLDGGRTWSQGEELVPGDIGGRGPVRNKLLRLRSGRILAPASVETQTEWNAFTDISDDGGETFHRGENVPLWRKGEPQPPCEGEYARIEGKGVIQPTLWQSADGNVHMLLRSTEGYILRSDSADEGGHWSPVRLTGLANNNSGIDLVQIEDGRIFLAMNPVSGNWAARTPITLCVSCDGGETFRPLMHMEIEPGEYSYPAIVARRNTLYISYTWNREKMAFWQIELE